MKQDDADLGHPSIHPLKQKQTNKRNATRLNLNQVSPRITLPSFQNEENAMREAKRSVATQKQTVG
jgi:hypothetical protein